MSTVEMTVPSYYQRFHCLADRCKDNCCRTGWEIEVDRETVAYYNSLPEPRRSRVLAGLKWEEEEQCWLIRPEEGGCPFLDERGLCTLVLELGEEHIGEICALHPRYREWFPGHMEMGVGLCCEEAARLILSDPQPAAFLTLPTQRDPADEEEEELPLFRPLFALRKRLIAILQDRNLPYARRLALLLRLAKSAQEALNRGEIPDPDRLSPSWMETEGESMQAVAEALISVHREMEVLEEDWMDQVRDLEDHLGALDLAGFRRFVEAREYEYEHLTVYFLFRYALKAALKACFDGDLLGKVWQSVVMTGMIALLGVRRWQREGHFALEDQIEVARQYSKEVEYSEENMELLREAFLFEEDLGLPSLIGMLED